MASLTLSSSMSGAAEAPDAVQDRILIAQGNLIASAQRKNALSMLNERGYGTGETAASIYVGSPKGSDGVRTLKIGFKGSRPNGKATKRNAEVAFLNEYGCGKTSARGFILLANEETADEAAGIAAAAMAEYLAEQLNF